MPPDDPPVDPPSLAEEWRTYREGASTRSRVYDVALQLHEPTRVRDVAERADVSKETARDYLKWFAELGVLDQVATSPDAFERNEAYFEWRRIERLAAQSEGELMDRLEELSRLERTYRERFGADGPDDVDATEHADFTDIESVWLAIQEWRTVRRRIRELDRARRRRDAPDRVRA